MMFINDVIYKIYERWIVVNHGLLKGRKNMTFTLSAKYHGPDSLRFIFGRGGPQTFEQENLGAKIFCKVLLLLTTYAYCLFNNRKGEFPCSQACYS